MHSLKFNIVDEEEDMVKREFAESLDREFNQRIEDHNVSMDLDNSTIGRELNLRRESIASIEPISFLHNCPIEQDQKKQTVIMATDDTYHGNVFACIVFLLLSIAVICTLGVYQLPILNDSIYSKIPYQVVEKTSPQGDNNFIPVLLDRSREKKDSVFTTLTNCLHLNSAPIKDYAKIVKDNARKIDFYTADSVCDVTQKMINNPNFRLFFIMENPILYNLEKYHESADGKIVNNGMKAPAHNSLIRSIICKMKGELTHHDLQNAKQFLKEKSYVGTMNNYVGSIKLFQNKFQWRKSLDKCIERNEELKKYSFSLQQSTNASLEDAVSSNFWDMSLYRSILSSQP